MSIGSLEPPCVKILGGSSDAMQVRVFEPPADPTEPPPGAEQSPFSVFQSAVVLLGSSNTSPSISNTEVGATAHAAVAVARIAAAPKGIKIRLEWKYRTKRILMPFGAAAILERHQERHQDSLGMEIPDQPADSSH